MAYKFEKLAVWGMAIDYADLCYALAEGLPKREEYNLRSQLIRAATSIALNIAEGSTSQTDAEQGKFLGYSIRSLTETVACQHLIHRRKYLGNAEALRITYRASEALFAKLQAFRNSLLPRRDRVREDETEYDVDANTPFD